MEIKAVDITKEYCGLAVLKNLSLQIPDKKITVIIGPNASGKTTLLKVLSLIDKPTGGSIYIDGTDTSKLDKKILTIRRNIAHVLQNSVLFSGTVLENIEYGLRIRKEKNAKEKIFQIAELLGLEHILNKDAKNISGGEKQRVALARALVLDTETIFFDEPTSNLDPLSTKIIEDVISFYSKKDKTIIIATHNLIQARKFADIIYFIENGKIVQSGNSEEVFSKPVSISCAEFTGAQNIIRGYIDNNSNFIMGNFKISVVSDIVDAQVFAVIRPEDILISNEPITDTSARNCIKGKIKEIKHLGQIDEVIVDVNGIEIMSIITKQSTEIMQLKSQKEVYIVFKASSVKIFKDEKVGN